MTIWLLKEKDCPGSLATSIIVCDPKKEPFFSILPIDCTLHVTSSECESSFSVLRNYKID